MSRKTRYAVDPSLVATSDGPPGPIPSPSLPSTAFSQTGYVQQQQQPLGDVSGPYAGQTAPRERSWAGELPSRPSTAAEPPQHGTGFGYDDSQTFGVQPTIAPLPHAPGPSLRGPKPRINPEQIPSQVEAAELDQNLFDGSDFQSGNPRGVIPTGTTDYRGIDQGNSLPRHLRATLCHTPSSSSLLDTAQLPFGLVVTPFAPSRYDEEPIPLVSDFDQANDDGNDAGGPPRCSKCRGYINPWVKWMEGGNRWVCNLCGSGNVVAASYHSHLDSYGSRLDIDARPELKFGTVDFAAPRSYWASNPTSILDASGLSSTGADLLASLNEAVAERSGTNLAGQDLKQKQREKAKQKEDEHARPPLPIGRVFAIDASWNAVRSGMIHEVCEGIREALYGEEGCDVEGRIAIVTFDQALQYYNLSVSLQSALSCTS